MTDPGATLRAPSTRGGHALNGIARGVAVASLALAATGCTDRIDVPGLEARLAQDLRSEYDMAFTVACPDDVEVGKGKNFRCTAEAADGTTLVLDMTQIDDEASITYEIVEG